MSRKKTIRGRAAAVAFVIDSERGELLLTQRSQKLQQHPGEWSLPGGMQEPGEMLEEALCRELHEEIGLIARECMPVGWTNTPYGVQVYSFCIFVDSKEWLKLEDNEIVQAVWVSLEEALSLEAHKGCIQNFVGREFWMPGWHFSQGVVWGVTYRLLSQLAMAV